MPAGPGIIAVDVGNSRVKLGWFPNRAACPGTGSGLPIATPLPEPADTLSGEVASLAVGRLAAWLDDLLEAGPPLPRVVVASVCQPASDRLLDLFRAWGERNGAPLGVEGLVATGLPLVLRVDEPDRLGVDRAVAAIAANRLRRPDTPAIVVDAGTAITVDLVAADGAFEGGAILPGIGMAARALHEQTALLPLVDAAELGDAPDALGKGTVSAIRAGLFWGAVGAVRELVDRLRDRLTTPPQVLLTGGAAPSVARLLAGPDYTVRFVPHLTLSGVALAADSSAGGGAAGAVQ